MNNRVSRIFTALVMSWIISPSPCKALQVYKFVDQQKTNALISRDNHTRIAVEEDRIQQIFGAEGLFDIQTDDERGQIFLKPLDKDISKPISITIVTEGGLTQDLRLTPRKIESQSILLKPNLSPEKSLVSQKTKKDQVLELMKAMLLHKSHEDHEKSPLHLIDRKTSKAVKLEPLYIYKGAQLKGRIYRVSNNSSYPITLSESRFSRQGDLALSLSQQTLRPQKHGYLYVISKPGENS